MRKIKVAIIIGTRPEAIKMVPVYFKMKTDPRIDPIMIVTAQHREMLDEVLNIFQIKPDIDLNLMRPNQSLHDLASRLTKKINDALIHTSPDVVLVHGDTSTCLYGALAAFYLQIPIGHVEAGLRTYNLRSPWPEEMNRRLVDPISDWCFAPTALSKNNLINESIPETNIQLTGNTVVDALNLAFDKIKHKNITIEGITETLFEDQHLILVTGHRRESFGEPFRQFCLSLCDIVRKHKDTVVVYPVHLNPNVKRHVNELLQSEDRIFLIKPVSYLAFIKLMSLCDLIITDSGGIQEEAPSFKKPVLITRENTERPEAIEAGLAKLVGTSRENILKETSRLLTDQSYYKSMTHGINPYGDGTASSIIVNAIVSDIRKGRVTIKDA